MRCGVLIIGSLFWDSCQNRDEWRKEHLDIDQKRYVKVPIRYGRTSDKRGGTFTMVFGGDDEPLGQGIIVPTKETLTNIEDLEKEAAELWKAECGPNTLANTIGAGWGCVGAMFRDEQASQEWLNQWTAYFHKKPNSHFHPVNCDGVLDIRWPLNTGDNTPADFDIIIATATEPDSCRPTSREIAKRWVCRGYEDYFFKNVYHEIETAEDRCIWEHMKTQAPDWKERWSEYEEATRMLERG